MPAPVRAGPVPFMLGPFPATTERAVALALGRLGTVPVTAFLQRSLADALAPVGAELLAGVVVAGVLAGVAAVPAGAVPGSNLLGGSTFAPRALRS